MVRFPITVCARCLGFPGSSLLTRAFKLSTSRWCSSHSTQMVAMSASVLAARVKAGKQSNDTDAMCPSSCRNKQQHVNLQVREYPLPAHKSGSWYWGALAQLYMTGSTLQGIASPQASQPLNRFQLPGQVKRPCSPSAHHITETSRHGQSLDTLSIQQSLKRDQSGEKCE